jgi:hypothetical protein
MKKLAVSLLAALMLWGCSSEPQKPAEKAAAPPAPEPTEYMTARAAFQRMYATARGWAPDAQPFRLQSQHSKEAPVAEGKAALWRAWFASPSRRAAKPYQWSGLTGPDAPDRGINPGPEDSFNPANASTRPFDIAFLKVDSDRAFAVAQEHGGKAIMEKDATQPVVFLLEWNARANKLIWTVIYGSSEHDAKLRVTVDATTGDFQRVVK